MKLGAAFHCAVPRYRGNGTPPRYHNFSLPCKGPKCLIWPLVDLQTRPMGGAMCPLFKIRPAGSTGQRNKRRLSPLAEVSNCKSGIRAHRRSLGVTRKRKKNRPTRALPNKKTTSPQLIFAWVKRLASNCPLFGPVAVGPEIGRWCCLLGSSALGPGKQTFAPQCK